jgi:hypothetical protein
VKTIFDEIDNLVAERHVGNHGTVVVGMIHFSYFL